jgi:hypothetical protein
MTTAYVLLFSYTGMLVGMFLMWIWLTKGSPTATHTKPLSINVLCSHCGRMYKSAPENVRTSNYCSACA